MRVMTMLAALIGFIMASAIEANETTANPKLLWMAEMPQCFEPSGTFPAMIESVGRFMVGGPVTGPVKISGEEPSFEEYDSTGETPAHMFFEMVINKEGAVELVASLRPHFPKTEELVARYLREWRFEPAAGPDGPICIRYVLSVRIC